MNQADFYGRGANWLSAGAVTSVVIGTSPGLGVQWKNKDRILYGGVIYSETGSTATSIFVFDLAALPANGAVAGGTKYFALAIAAAPSQLILPNFTSGMYFANGIVIAGSTTAPPTFTVASANLLVSVVYDRVT